MDGAAFVCSEGLAEEKLGDFKGVISKYISSAHIPINISQTHQCTLKPDTWEGGLEPVKSCFPSLSRECVRVVTKKYVLDQRNFFSHSRMIIISSISCCIVQKP